MKIPKGLNHLFTVLYLRRKGVEWKGEIPHMDMRRPPRFYLNVSGKIVLGSGVKFFTDVERTCFQVADGAVIDIGDHTVLNGVWIHCDREVTIGSRVHIGPGVKIIDSNMHPRWPGDNQTPRPVKVGRGCWLCMDSCILPGVEIGEQAIVGAASVVTRNVLPRTTVAGNPLRTIKTLERHFECHNDWIRG